MNLVKVYIVQSITAASNNLRLNTQQIEVVGLLRETIINAGDLADILLKMKKSTLFSKLAIRLDEIYNFLTRGKIDFLKISEQFREHSRYLIRDLNQFLESVSPKDYKEAMSKIHGEENEVIDIDFLHHQESRDDLLDSARNKLKEEIIMQDENEDKESFYSFEEQILSPIKAIDNLLKRITSDNIDGEGLEKYGILMAKHSVEAADRGFGILSDMHKIISLAFNDIISGTLKVNKTVVDSLRACLIVIAAVIKGKELDITDYLNRAEEFGKKYFESNNRILNK